MNDLLFDPDESLDDLVAGAVMGWTLRPNYYVYSREFAGWLWNDGERDRGGIGKHRGFRPSSDGNDTIEVLNKLYEYGLKVSMEQYDDGKWVVYVKDTNIGRVGVGGGPSLPRAICFAAVEYMVP